MSFTPLNAFQRIELALGDITKERVDDHARRSPRRRRQERQEGPVSKEAL